MQSLGHACIFCTSNPRGQTTFFASYELSGNSLSFGSISFIITSNFPNPLSDTPFSAFHCSNSSVVPSFFLSPTQFPHCCIIVFREPMASIAGVVLFFFIVFHHNPSFSVLGPNIIVGHEIRLKQVDVNDFQLRVIPIILTASTWTRHKTIRPLVCLTRNQKSMHAIN